MNSDREFRFPQVRLADVASVVRGSSPRPAGDPRFFKGDFLPWITVADLTSSDQPTLTSTLSRLTEEGAERTRIFEPGTVLLTNSGATLGVPKICGIRAGANDGIAGFLNLSAELDSFYLYYCLSILTEYFRTKVASGVGQPNLNTELIGDVHVPKPPLNVQHAVVRVLSTWDRGIRQLTDLITVKQRSREGLVQRLLSGSLRFWEFSKKVHEQVPLNQVLEKVSDSVGPSSSEMYREIGVRSHGKGIFHKEPVSGKSLGNKRVYRVVPGCLTFNIVFAWERAVAITTAREEGMIASHRFPMFRPDPDRLLAEYALLYVLSKKGSEALELASPGGAGRNRTLSQTDFLKNLIPLPCIAEQRQVVTFVQAADREIELLRKQLEALKQQKKGLMRKLLTGQVRVGGVR